MIGLAYVQKSHHEEKIPMKLDSTATETVSEVEAEQKWKDERSEPEKDKHSTCHSE